MEQEWLMKIEVSAPGKVFLSGEYLALEGSLATVLPTKQRAKIVIEDSECSTNILHSLPLDKSFTFDVKDSFDIEWLGNDPKELGLFMAKAIILMKIKKKFMYLLKVLMIRKIGHKMMMF